jgi:hypothetical protein
MTDTHIIFFHGWGYDASFWDRHIADYTHNDTKISYYNRGYLGEYHKPLLGKAPKGVMDWIAH